MKLRRWEDSILFKFCFKLLLFLRRYGWGASLTSQITNVLYLRKASHIQQMDALWYSIAFPAPTTVRLEPHHKYTSDFECWTFRKPIIRAAIRTIHQYSACLLECVANRWKSSRGEFPCYSKNSQTFGLTIGDTEIFALYTSYSKAGSTSCVPTHEFIHRKFFLAAPFADVQRRSSERFVYQCFLYGRLGVPAEVAGFCRRLHRTSEVSVLCRPDTAFSAARRFTE